MAIYDKNQKRLRELEKKLAAGGDPDRLKARIARLKAKGPDYYVKGYAYGKAYDEKVPEPGLKAAKAYDMKIKVGVREKTYTPAELMRRKLRDIFESYRDAQAGKGGAKAARTRCGHACRIFGAYRLEALHNSPKTILAKGFAQAPEDWAQKTRWQLWSFMRSSIGVYLSENPKILIKNPMDAYPVAQGTEHRHVFPTWEEHQAVLAHLRQNPLRWVKQPGKPPHKAGYPPYLIALLTTKYEQGLRGMEIIPWRHEKMDLVRAHGKYPAAMTRILKKGKRRDQWVVLTPTSYKAIQTYLQAVPGPKEVGPLWPVRNWPTALVRRVLDACGLPHLWAHDYRRAWTMNNIDAPGPRRRAAIGKETESGEAPYIHFNRQEQEALYAPLWAGVEA